MSRHPQDREAQRVSDSANLACTLWIKTLVLTLSFAAIVFGVIAQTMGISVIIYIYGKFSWISKDKVQKTLINRDKIELSE